MDTGEYETNVLLINHITSVTYAFYELVSSPLTGPVAAELETALRKDGHLVYVDISKKGVWCFRPWRSDVVPPDVPNALRFPQTIEIIGLSLQLVQQNCFEPVNLVKNRLHGPNFPNTPTSSSGSSTALDNYKGSQTAAMPASQAAWGTPAEESKAVVATDSKTSATASPKEAYENFISATLSYLISGYCAQTGALPLNSCTVLLPAAEGDDINSSAVLGTLRAYMTTTGAMVITMSLSAVDGLITLAQSINHQLPPLGLTILAAPIGMFATCQAIAEVEGSAIEGSIGQSPITQIFKLAPEKNDRPWRNVCSRFLRARNMSSSVSGSESWLGLRRFRRRPIDQKADGTRTPMMSTPAPSLSWPANLCFCKSFSQLQIKDGADEATGSKQELNMDTLTMAKDWFANNDERLSILASKRKERESAAMREMPAANGQGQQQTALSPVALRPPSNTGALGAVYPTPPDGVQATIGATPTMDGTVSSPGNVATTTAMVDIDTGMNGQPDSYGEQWENTEIKRERNGGSFLAESENLFGDLGPDVFGENDITDADFSFFDEQPGDVGLGSLELPELPTSTAELHSINLEVTSKIVPKPEPAESQIQHNPPSPKFTKPELKHARSSLTDENRRHADADAPRSQAAAGIKRQASPFTPDTVFKRIKASLDNYKATQHNPRLYQAHGGSIFEKVDFDPSLSVVDSKYHGRGRFDFASILSQESKQFQYGTPSTKDYLKRHTLRHRKGPPRNIQDLLRIPGVLESNSLYASPAKMDEVPSDAEEASLVSDEEDSSYDSDEPPSPAKAISIRRRRVDDDGESLATSFRELETIDGNSSHTSLDLPSNPKPGGDLSLTRYFADPEPLNYHFSLADEDLILAAQLLTEQAAISTLCLPKVPDTKLHSGVDRRRDLLNTTRATMQEIRSALPTYFGESTSCLFKPLVEVQDVPLPGQPTRMQPRPPGMDQIKPNNLFQIPSPHFEVRRYESKLSVLPSAVAFWESLGLGPSKGPKDITALCVFQDIPGVADGVSGFMERMRSMYESLKLGSYARLPTSDDITDGLVPIEPEKNGEGARQADSVLGTSLQAAVGKITKAFSALTVKKTNFVVYFVYSYDQPASAVDSCLAFHQLFGRYKKFLQEKRIPVENEIVLQLLPMRFVASSDSITSPPPSDFVRLSLETYDRCTLWDNTMPAPAIVLEQQPPRMIDFKLSIQPSASLLHENACYHVAYAQSVDERWITAAWTDNRGSQQLTASYCLGRKGKSLATPFADVAQEIWETTKNLISIWKVHWRVIVTKSGVMEQAEIDTWSSLASAESKAAITLTLMTVDTNPSLQLLPPAVKIPNNVSNAFYTTPVSTPQASILSPEQSGANPPTPMRDSANSAPTPGGSVGEVNNATESDADATLVDVTDQTWGAVLGHRLSNSNSFADLNPALVSGYLIKRSGPRVEDPPVVMEVNVVHSDGNPRAYESLLREMLGQFRGLGSLARARGVVERECDIRPWHVAAAERAVRVLYLLM